MRTLDHIVRLFLSASTAGIGACAGAPSSSSKDYDPVTDASTTSYDASSSDTLSGRSSEDAGYPTSDIPRIPPLKDTYEGKDVQVLPKDDGQPYDGGKDDDKGGSSDDPDTTPLEKICLDNDKDGRAPTGTPPQERLDCEFKDQDDCDDKDPDVNPGMPEIKYNGKDDDCDKNTPDKDYVSVTVSHGLTGKPLSGIEITILNAVAGNGSCVTDNQGVAECELSGEEGNSLDITSSGFHTTVRSSDEVAEAVAWGEGIVALLLPKSCSLEYLGDATGTSPTKILDGKEVPNDVVNYSYPAVPLKFFVPQNYVVQGVNYTPAMEAGIQKWIDALQSVNPDSDLIQIVKNESDANVVVVPYSGNSKTAVDKFDDYGIVGGVINLDKGSVGFGFEGVEGTIAHEITHCIGMIHVKGTKYPLDIAIPSGGSGEVGSNAVCVALYLFNNQNVQNRNHLKIN